MAEDVPEKWDIFDGQRVLSVEAGSGRDDWEKEEDKSEQRTKKKRLQLKSQAHFILRNCR
ncbi:MAG: hypothetical protein AAF570_11250 [Bacteroidota bacterium]